MKKDFYEILGITKSATEAEIKKAYRKKRLSSIPIKTLATKRRKKTSKKPQRLMRC